MKRCNSKSTLITAGITHVAVLAILLSTSFSTRGERLPLKAYTTADGLAHNVINKIVRDSRGFRARENSRMTAFIRIRFGIKHTRNHPMKIVKQLFGFGFGLLASPPKPHINQRLN